MNTIDAKRSDLERIMVLIKSVGLPAPEMGEENRKAFPKLVDAFEKLIAVAKAAKEYVEGNTPYYDTPLAEALAALEFK